MMYAIISHHNKQYINTINKLIYVDQSQSTYINISNVQQYME